jgi:maleate isomerase
MASAKTAAAAVADTPEIDAAPVVVKRGMAYEMDDGLGPKARIGLIVLASDQTIEHEFRQIITMPDVALYESRLYCALEVNIETLKAMEGDIAPATELLVPGSPLDVVAFGCTSGGMVIGDETVFERIREARPDVACTTPMTSAFAALRALGARRVCLITPYIDAVADTMRAYVQENGFEVPVSGSWSESDDLKVARISPDTIKRAVLDLGASDEVDAVFVSCTSLRVAGIVEELEAEIGKPVTSSNHAMVWHCLRLAGYQDAIPGFGKLFHARLD